MPTTNTGAQSDSTYPAVQTNQIDVDDEIEMLEGSVGLFAPFFTRSMKKAATSVKVEWLEDERQPVYTAIGTDALASGVDTTMDVTAGTGQHLKVGDVLHVETTGENLFIQSFNSADNLNVIRGWGTTSAAAAVATVGLVRVANNSAQGSSYPTPKSTVVVGQYNYQGITKTSWAFVESATFEKFRGEPNALDYQKKKHLLEHLSEIEYTIWLGQRFQSTAATSEFGTQPIYSAAGLDALIQTNKTQSVGALTQAVWENWLLTKAFAYGEILESKLIVCSAVVANAIQGFAAGKLAPPDPSIKKWGVRIQNYQSVLGDVNLVVHPDWRQFYAGRASNSSLGGSAYAIDMSTFYLKGFRTTKFQPELQNPGTDGKVNQYLTEFAPVLKQEKRSAKLNGVTS
jgi:hypothetical protein